MEWISRNSKFSQESRGIEAEYQRTLQIRHIKAGHHVCVIGVRDSVPQVDKAILDIRGLSEADV